MRLCVGRASNLNLQVKDERGTPIEEFGVRCVPAVRGGDGVFVPDHDALAGLGRPKVRLQGHHPGGRLRLPDVWRGWNLVTVVPSCLDFAVLRARPVFVGESTAGNLDAVLVRSRSVRVRVLDPAGQPLAGANVRWAGAGRSEARLGTRGVRKTGAKGWVRLIHDGALRTVSVRAPGFVPCQREVMTDAATIVEMQLAGSVSGRIPTPSCIDKLGLVPVDREEAVATVRVGPSGIVRFSDVAPGSYRVIGWAEYDLSEPGRYRTGHVPLASDLGLVSVAAGATARVNWDHQAARAGSMRGRVWLAGSPAPASWVYLQRTGKSVSRLGPYPVADGGRFAVGGLVPGDYVVQWSRGGAVHSSQPQTVSDTRVWSVRGDKEAVVAIELATRRLVVTLTGLPSRLLGQVRARLAREDDVAEARIGENGVVVFAMAPIGKATLSIPGRTDLRFAPIDVVPGIGPMLAERCVQTIVESK